PPQQHGAVWERAGPIISRSLDRNELLLVTSLSPTLAQITRVGKRQVSDPAELILTQTSEKRPHGPPRLRAFLC
ncbi:unnamed protein product, partial [Mycena citricolor]